MKKNITAALLSAALGGWLTAAAAADTVYRCGDSYSTKPCPGGKAVQVDDARSAAQKAQTDRAAQNDAKAAETMEKARVKEEAKPAQAIMPPPKAEEPPAPQPKPVAAAKAKKPEHFTAVSPKKPGDADKKKKKKKPKKSAA